MVAGKIKMIQGGFFWSEFEDFSVTSQISSGEFVSREIWEAAPAPEPKKWERGEARGGLVVAFPLGRDPRFFSGPGFFRTGLLGKAELVFVGSTEIFGKGQILGKKLQV